MLIDFSARNFASFEREVTLSAETGARLSRLKETNTIRENTTNLLKSLVVIGPNGSGKSNLLEGLRYMRSMVLNDTTKATDKLPYRPFLLQTESPNQPTLFSVRFNHSGKEFKYEFEYTRDQIVREQLTTFSKASHKVYFQRQGQQFPVLSEQLKSVANATKSNSLLLFGAQKSNDTAAISVMQWFQEDLLFVNDVQIPDKLAELVNDDRIKNELLRFLQFADFNIIDVKVRDVPVTVPEQFVEVLRALKFEGDIPQARQALYAVHKKYNADGDVVGQQEIPLERESKGTGKIFLIALSIIYAQLTGNGKTLLFDEFDDSLHFELSRALLDVFNSKQNQNQFILTTHELQLLNSNLRTDQIYLVEKNFKGRSELKSIFDFQDSRSSARNDVQFMKRYIEGRFGAVPQIRLSGMLDALNQSQPAQDLEK